MSRHIVLLGDSSFDNASYTRGEPDVANHLRALVPSTRVTLLALDGATTIDVERQAWKLPVDATHVVLSVGGNDALLCASLLDTPCRSTAGALDLFGAALRVFDENHRNAVGALVAPGRSLVVATIYEGNLGLPEAPRAKVALRMWNDVIARSARFHGAQLLEMRDVCNLPEHFANPIEPSGAGGRRIAEAIARMC